MTIAELAVLGAVLALLLWVFRPLQRWVRKRVERLMLRGKHGKVIEGRFRTVPRPTDPPTDPTGGPSGPPGEPDTKH